MDQSTKYKKTDPYPSRMQKILKTILANQIPKYIQSILYRDKAGFILVMQSWFDMQKSITVIHHANEL